MKRTTQSRTQLDFPVPPRLSGLARARLSVCVSVCVSVCFWGCGGGGPEVTSAQEASQGAESAPPGSSRDITSGPDADADGVPDHLDRCADEPGERLAGGCPAYDEDLDGTPEAWSEFQCESARCSQSYCVRETPELPIVYFPQARSTTSTSGIAALARALGESGDVYVAGHTSVGEDAALGLQRAQWVIARLASAGVPSARLQAVGFGSHWGKSSTPPGMDEDAAERRVELHATWFGPPGCSPHPVPLDKCPIPCE